MNKEKEVIQDNANIFFFQQLLFWTQFAFRSSKVIDTLECRSQFKLYYSYFGAEILRVIYMYKYLTAAIVKKIVILPSLV